MNAFSISASAPVTTAPDFAKWTSGPLVSVLHSGETRPLLAAPSRQQSATDVKFFELKPAASLYEAVIGAMGVAQVDQDMAVLQAENGVMYTTPLGFSVAAGALIPASHPYGNFTRINPDLKAVVDSYGLVHEF